MRTSARAIILDQHNRLLVFERERQHSPFQSTHHYYSIPGGGLESGETPEVAVIRELHEEMLVDIAPKRLLIHQVDETSQREMYYFLARITAGTPTFNPHSEEARRTTLFVKNSYQVAWSAPNDPLLRYYPEYAQVADLLVQWLDEGSFPAEPVDIRLKNQ